MNLKDFQKLNFLLQCEIFTSVDQSENHEMADDLPDNKDMNLPVSYTHLTLPTKA